VKTPTGRHWSEPEFRRDFVALSEESAAWLVAQGVLPQSVSGFE